LGPWKSWKNPVEVCQNEKKLKKMEKERPDEMEMAEKKAERRKA